MKFGLVADVCDHKEVEVPLLSSNVQAFPPYLPDWRDSSFSLKTFAELPYVHSS